MTPQGIFGSIGEVNDYITSHSSMTASASMRLSALQDLAPGKGYKLKTTDGGNGIFDGK